MSAEEWVEDENHQTIDGNRWVAKVCDGWCSQPRFPVCEMSHLPECKRFGKYHCESGQRRDGREVRWYRADSPALAFFDKPKEDVAKAEKPPLGLNPRYIHDHERYVEICGAIQRYYDAGKKIPVEWIEEYNELVEKEKCE